MRRPSALIRLLLLPVLLLSTPAGGATPELDQILVLATRGGGCEDPAQRAALRLLVDEGLAARDASASTWAWLDLWLRAEWEDDSLLPRRREEFRRAWPAARYQESADWMLARWLARRGQGSAAAHLLLDLAATGGDGRLREEAGRLFAELWREQLDGRQRDELSSSAGGAGRRWLAAWRDSRRVTRTLAVVAPLSGSEAIHGRALAEGAEAAIRLHRRGGGASWQVSVHDSQSDPWLARDLLQRAASQGPDAILLSGDASSLSAAAGWRAGRPIVVPEHGGPPLHTLSPDLLQFGLDAEALGSILAEVAVDSLDASGICFLAPASRPAHRVLQGLHGGLRRSGRSMGPEQWYFPGARSLEVQLGNLQDYRAGLSGPAVWVMLGAEEEGERLAEVLTRIPVGDRVLGDRDLGVALENCMPPGLEGRLLLLADWLPPGYAGQAGLGAAGEAYRRDLFQRENRAPTAAESRAHECVRLVIGAGERAAATGLDLGGTLARLPLPSLAGPSLDLERQRAAGAWLLGWNGRSYEMLGGRIRAEGTN
ncbi:MAG: ABC transporter substrate-binding protein [bacterium]|jgi:hypothetical protein|nr:ABC transporter substrate-binding protein [bacterium]